MRIEKGIEFKSGLLILICGLRQLSFLFSSLLVVQISSSYSTRGGTYVRKYSSRLTREVTASIAIQCLNFAVVNWCVCASVLGEKEQRLR